MTAAEIPLRVVTRAEFDAIECNRCGECCERFYLSTAGEGWLWWNYTGPLGFLELWCYRLAHGADTGVAAQEFHAPQIPNDPSPMLSALMWYGQLTPERDDAEDGVERWRYSCGHFTRDDDGNGVCGIYETRPLTCSALPYGHPQTTWAACSWNVGLIEDDHAQRDLRRPALDGMALAVVA